VSARTVGRRPQGEVNVEDDTDTAGDAFPALMCAHALCAAIAASAGDNDLLSSLFARDQLEARALWALQAERVGARELCERFASETRAIDDALAEMQYATLFARDDVARA
jgi:hypothetical protein